MYRIQFQSGRNKGKRLVVRQSAASVGAAKSCMIRLREQDCPWAVAFRLEKRPEGVVPVAGDAGDALRVNGVAPVAELPLQHGDVVAAGNVELQYQDIIPPDAPRLRPGGGVAQALATLAILFIMGTELALLAFTANWPEHIIDENVERLDIAYAQRQRKLEQQMKEESGGEDEGEGREKTADASSIIVMPGSSLVEAKASGKKAGVGEGGEAADAGGEGETAAVPAPEKAATESAGSDGVPADLPGTLREMLAGADFTPAQLGDVMSDMPEVAVLDAITDNLESMLSQARVAAQFSDYPRAIMLLNQLHKMAPGYLPAHMYHAELLESRGDLEAAYGRWRQLLGLVGKDDPARDEIIRAGRRLQRKLKQQKNVGGHAGVDPASLPRHVRISDASMQKMPSDSEIAEMRILRGKVELAEGGAEEAEGGLELYVTFYDQKPDGKVVPTKALVSPSPLRLGTPGAVPSGAIPFEATYIVPAVRRGGGQEKKPHESLYHGYTLHLFAGGELQDAWARPARLLQLPIHVPAPAGAN